MTGPVCGSPGGRGRLPELYAEAEELDPESRRRFVEGLTESDPGLARELTELLAVGPAARERLAVWALDRLTADRPPDPEPIPERVGPYRVLEELGRGGMGRVFLALEEREAFSRRVALKIVDRPWASGERLRRFKDEVRILAALEHPGIARFLDGGRTSEGIWYLALEYVEGRDLVAFCSTRGLDLEARVRLFVEVLKAVAHAHDRGVVHRDLKPANILVDAEGRPRLLDFGVAKLLEEDAPEAARATRTEHRAFTPAYASPEQFLGAPVLPASDVFSAGVVLYELLAGRRPHDGAEATRGSLERAVLSTDPPPPSLRRRTRGADARRQLSPAEARPIAARRFRRDLDAICLQALRRAPSARYPSAHELAEDLERFLAGRPVRARRGGWIYRGESFLRRHRAPVSGAAGAALLAAAIAFLIPVGRAGRPPAASPPPLPADGPALPEIGSLSARFALRPDEPELGLELVDALLARGRGEEAMATVERIRQIPDLGAAAARVDFAEAQAALAVSEFQRAAVSSAAALERARLDADERSALRARLVQAQALLRLTPPEESEKRLAELFADAERAGEGGIAARALLARSQAARRGARAAEARTLVGQALERQRAFPDRSLESEALAWRARLEGEAGELDRALASIDEALRLARAIPHLEREGAALATASALHNWRGDEAEAVRASEAAIQKLRLAGNRELLLTQLTNLSLTRIEQADLTEAATLISEAEGFARALGNPLQRGSVLRARGYLEESRGRHDLARSSYEGAALAAREAGASEALATYLSDLAWLEMNADRAAAAAAAAREASALFRKGGDERSALHSDCVLAWSEARAGSPDAARRRLDGISSRAEGMNSDSLRYSVLMIRAALAELTGRWREAVDLRRETAAAAAEFVSPGLVLSQRVELAKALSRAGDDPGALALARELLPEAERLGRGDVARDCRALLAAGS